MNDLDLARLAEQVTTANPTWQVDKDVAGLLAVIDGVKIASFRGTRKPTVDLFGALYDIRRDLDIAIVNDQQLGGCHQGFITGGRAIAPDVMSSIGNDPWIAIGHSLGGAIAIIVAAEAIVNGWPPLAVVTYGAPRVGFAKLRSIFDGSRVRQYRRGNDPVTEVPEPMQPWFPYVHIREPLISVGHYVPEIKAATCHRMTGYIDDIAVLLGQQT